MIVLVLVVRVLAAMSVSTVEDKVIKNVVL